MVQLQHILTIVLVLLTQLQNSGPVVEVIGLHIAMCFLYPCGKSVQGHGLSAMSNAALDFPPPILTTTPAISLIRSLPEASNVSGYHVRLSRSTNMLLFSHRKLAQA
jgi:hypothetical protein